MQLSSGSHIPDGLLAANVLLSEKPRLGVPSWNLALHQGISEANCTAAIGLRASESLNRVQSRYTGKERDAESGLDYFGARYYSSSMGRFMSPDWSAGAVAIPYADLQNPQSLNLYGYVGNNPLSRADANGHFWKELKNWLVYGYWTRDTDGAQGMYQLQQHSKHMQDVAAEHWASNFWKQNGTYVVSATLLTSGIYGASTGPTAPEVGEGVADAEVGAGWVKVGRWMSQDELANMKATGVAQESTELGGSRVALPADASAYKGAPAGSVYVEYEIPAGVAKPAGSGWARIPGPGSIEGRLAASKGEASPQMPAVRNIVVKGQQ